MEVPSGCLPEGVAECTLKVAATLATNVSLPEDTTLCLPHHYTSTSTAIQKASYRALFPPLWLHDWTVYMYRGCAIGGAK